MSVESGLFFERDFMWRRSICRSMNCHSGMRVWKAMMGVGRNLMRRPSNDIAARTGAGGVE